MYPYYEASFSFFANVSHDHDTHAGKMLPLVPKEKWDNTQCSLILTDPYVSSTQLTFLL